MSNTPTNGVQAPQQQYSGHAYAQGSMNQQSAYAVPPAKRQRMSPEAQSPTVNYANGTYRAPPPALQTHSNSFGAQYSPVASQAQYQQQYAAAHQPAYSPNTFNTPDSYAGVRQPWNAQQAQSYQAHRPNAASPSSSQMMPPPPKPVKEDKEEKVGVDDINDALFSSGINLKDEENYMHNLYTNRHTANDSFATQPASFSSSQTVHDGSFNLLTQGTSFGSQPNSYGAGTIGPAMTEESIETELKHKRTFAARQKAEYEQHHLRNPFLSGNIVQVKMHTIAKANGVSMHVEGLYMQKPQAKVMVNGSGTEGIVAARPAYQLDTASPLADILSLISLAAGERVRGLLDEAYGLARARRCYDNGKVPIEFADVAVGDGEKQSETILPESITGTSWDRVADSTSDQPLTTHSFQSSINQELRKLAKHDQDGEAARLKKREARRKAAEAASAIADDAAIDTVMSTDAAAAATAADGKPDAKISKKELARQQKEKASFTEQQAATTTNQTAALMAMGSKAKRYNWMTGASASMPTNRFAKPAASSTPGSGTGTPSRKDGTRTPVAAGSAAPPVNEMTWGTWRESSKGGRGIQSRDWVLVLERDGRQKKAWHSAAVRMGDQSAEAVAPAQS